MTKKAEDDIVERLLKVEPDEPGDRTRWYRNPDGPDAAAEITRLRAREAELVEALRPFAEVGKVIEGPFGPAVFSDDEDAFKSGCVWTEDGETKTLTWGMFRRARALTAQQEGDGDD